MSKDITRDMCKRGHRYARLPDHPKIDGIHVCPHCTASAITDSEGFKFSLDTHEYIALDKAVTSAHEILYADKNQRPPINEKIPYPNIMATTMMIRLMHEIVRLRRIVHNTPQDPLMALIGSMVSFATDTTLTHTADEAVFDKIILDNEKVLKDLTAMAKSATRESGGKITWLKTNLSEIIRIAKELKRDLK